MSSRFVVPVTPDAVARQLAAHREAAEGAYAAETERAYRNDTALFTAWCQERSRAALPAEPDTIAAFVDAMSQTRAPATVRRYVASIAALHRAAGMLQPPCSAEAVTLALRRMHRRYGRRQRQATGLTLDLRNRMLDYTPDTVRGARDRALLAVAYDALLRRSELVALRVDDLEYAADGSATALVATSKADQEGEGRMVWLAPDTVQTVQAWLNRTGLSDGQLFRSVRKNGSIGLRLSGRSVSRLFKKMAADARVSPELVERISGHSTRVGAAQDMSGFGLDIGEIMQAGRWATPSMVARYTERIAARRGGAAKLATLQNRTQ